MTLLRPHPLQTLLESISEDAGPYSGRGMYGEKCLAVSGIDLGDLIAEVVLLTAELGYEKPEEVAQISQAFRSLKTDSLGRGQVVYFPAVAHFEAAPLCEFDECDHHATEDRAPFCYCAQHASEYDAMTGDTGGSAR